MAQKKRKINREEINQFLGSDLLTLQVTLSISHTDTHTLLLGLLANIVSLSYQLILHVFLGFFIVIQFIRNLQMKTEDVNCIKQQLLISLESIR